MSDNDDTDREESLERLRTFAAERAAARERGETTILRSDKFAGAVGLDDDGNPFPKKADPDQSPDDDSNTGDDT